MVSPEKCYLDSTNCEALVSNAIPCFSVYGKERFSKRTDASFWPPHMYTQASIRKHMPNTGIQLAYSYLEFEFHNFYMLQNMGMILIVNLTKSGSNLD